MLKQKNEFKKQNTESQTNNVCIAMVTTGCNYYWLINQWSNIT